MRGEIVHLELLDLGGTLDLRGLEQALAQRHPTRGPAIGKGTPAYVEFPRPLVDEIGGLPLQGPMGPVEARVTLVYFPIGAVSVRFRFPFEVEALEDLRNWEKSTVQIDGRALSLEGAARALMERDRRLWEGSVRDRYTTNILTEAYTVFAFSDAGEPAEAFLERRSREVAGLLKGEEGDRLHEKEVKEAVRKWFSYYSDDIIVVDWDAAFIIDPSPEYEDLIFVLEIANLQLLEFRAYDDYLDDVTARGYDELQVVFRKISLFSKARKTAHDLSLLRMEVAELADEADNITKFLGDWFLARVYEAASEKFHTAAWRATVDEKLATLHNLYVLASTESDNRRLLVLEVLIVLLFILDLAVLIFRR